MLSRSWLPLPLRMEAATAASTERARGRDDQLMGSEQASAPADAAPCSDGACRSGTGRTRERARAGRDVILLLLNLSN